MTEEDVKELYYIAPIENLTSILKRGILSHRDSKRFKPRSIAEPGVQDRRAKVWIPGGLSLHSYANLYFNPRNPMMFKRKLMHKELAIVRVSKDVLRADGVVIADRNAAASDVRFGPSPNGLEYVKGQYVFATYWNDDDIFLFREKKAVICAEVLVPRVVQRDLITGLLVSCEESLQRVGRVVQKENVQLPVAKDPGIFFCD